MRTADEEMFERAQKLLEEGCLMSGVAVLEEGRRQTGDPDALALASYDLGATHWARLGNGDAARREFAATVAIFDQYGQGKISRRFHPLLPNVLENAMLLALSFDEFEHLSARVQALTPDALTVTQLTPETLKARDEGQPWSDQLFKIAENYYDANDSSRDPGRYGEARSTYQILLDHRRELRLARDRWRLATYELGALSLRMVADCLRAHENSGGTYSPGEFLPILADAVPLIDDYLAHNPGDTELEDMRSRSDSFVVRFREAGPSSTADGPVAQEPGVRTAVPHCYRCAEEGHIREMQLVTSVMTDMTKWDKPWSPTQGCLQCGNCGRLTCWTHSDNREPCECGVTHWVERVYLQMELDNG